MAQWPVLLAVWGTASLTIAVLAALQLLYTSLVYQRFLTPLKAIPTPPGWSLLKGTPSPPSANNQIAKLRYWSSSVPNNGLVRFYHAGNIERLLVTGAQTLGEILVTKANDFEFPETVRQRLIYVTGNGLLLAQGEEHKVQRKSLMPAFSFRHVRDLYPVFWSKAQELARCLEKEAALDENTQRRKAVEIRQWASRATLDIIGLTGMHQDFNTLQDPQSILFDKYQQMRPAPVQWETTVGLLLSMLFGTTNAALILSRLPTRQKNAAVEASGYVRNVCRDMIKSTSEKARDHLSSKEHEIDILTVAQRSAAFTEENLVDQMMTFLAAGHGTTSHALQWAVYALCKHEEIQKRLREAIRTKLPAVLDVDTAISATDVDNLHYLHAFCNEVLRVYPPVPSTARQAVRDTTISNYRIPKGTIFNIAPALTNVDPELWGPDAETFNPDRWLGPDGTANNTGGVKSNYGFSTFLHGPRSCIGAMFARAELVCLVAAIVGRFRLRLEEPGKEAVAIRRGVVIAPADGVRVVLEVVEP